MQSTRIATVYEILVGSYFAFLIFVLTQGPVYRLVYSDAQSSLKPDALVVAFAIFVMAQIPALVAARFSEIKGLGRDFGAICVLCAFLLLTSLWSTARAATITAAASFALTAFVAVSLVARLKPRTAMWSVMFGLQPGLILSACAVYRKWPQAIEAKSSLEPWITTKNWVGVYGNRNSLAPVAGIGMLTGLFVLWQLLRGPSRIKILRVAPVIVITSFDAFVLFRSGSATIPFALVIASIALVALNLILQFVQRKPKFVRHRQIKYPVMLLLMSILVVGLQWLHQRYDRLSGFDGRTDYWRASLEAWKHRPIFGWGFMALWNTNSFRNNLPSRISGATWGHSSYFDALTGGGLLLAILFLGIIGVVTVRALFVPSTDIASAWMSLVALTILLASTQESFLLGNHFFLLLLIFTGVKLRLNRLSTGMEH